jgi:putative sterol carrier protein
MDPTAEIEAFFHSVEVHCWRPDLSAESGIAEFDISGVGVWYVTLKDGMCTVVRGGRPAKLPDVIFHQSPETFLRIVDKKDPLNPTTAALQGLLVVDGDMHFAWAMLEENIEG